MSKRINERRRGPGTKIGRRSLGEVTGGATFHSSAQSVGGGPGYVGILETPRRGAQALNALAAADPGQFDLSADSFLERFHGLVTPSEDPRRVDVRHMGPNGWTTSQVELEPTRWSSVRGQPEAKAFLTAIDQDRASTFKSVPSIWQAAGLRVADTSPFGAVQAAELGRPAVLQPNPGSWGDAAGWGHHTVIGVSDTHYTVEVKNAEFATMPRESLDKIYLGGYVAEHPDFITKASPNAPSAEGARPFVRGAGGLAGGAMLLSGLGETLAKDGLLPPSVGQALAPINHIAGTVLAPFSPTQGAIGETVRNATDSFTLGLLADGAADGAIFAGVAAAAGAPAALLTGGLVGLHYLAEKSDFAQAGRAAVKGVEELGIDTAPGTFGQALAADFRGATSGLASNPEETNRALDNFAQLYTSNVESGADLALQSKNGWGSADADRQDRLTTLRDTALSSAADTSLQGGAIFFPDGSNASYTNAAYTPPANEAPSYDEGSGTQPAAPAEWPPAEQSYAAVAQESAPAAEEPYVAPAEEPAAPAEEPAVESPPQLDASLAVGAP